MSYTEASLKALTVVKLKEILAQHSLSVTGKKDELIQRILESNLSASSEETTLDPTSNSTDEPDGDGVGSNQELAPAAATTATEPVPAVPENEPSKGEETKPEQSEQEIEQQRQERLKEEEDKRKQRLARFGGGASTTTTTSTNGVEAEEAKKKRAEKFGLPLSEDPVQNDQQRLNKSLDLLDKPLGSNKRQRTTNKKDDKTVAQKLDNPAALAEPAAAAAAATAVDPELQKKLAEEEEKKKKRLARFGPQTDQTQASEPQEKKTKTD